MTISEVLRGFMYNWTKFYRLRVNQQLKIYQIFIFLGFFSILNTTLADAKGPHIETSTIFGKNCFSSYSPFNDLNNILYQEDFEIHQELVYEACGITCYNRGRRRQCYDNSYFQDKLDPVDENQELNRSLDPRCTYRVLKIADDTAGKFLDCDSFDDPNPQKRRRQEKPCLSKRLHHAVHQSLTEISSCFRIDPKLFFAIMANESKLHPLAKNSTSTATGPGQLVTSYVDNYSNRSHITFDVLKEEVLPVLSRQNSDCRIVQNKISQFSKFEKRPICQRTNIYVNMLYTMMGLMDAISRLTPVALKGQEKSFSIPQNSPFQGLINKYESDLNQEKDRNSTIEHNLRDARSRGNSAATSVRELESAFDYSNRQVRNLDARGRFFRNLARFQGLDPNDKKLVSELSIYWFYLPNTALFQTYVDDRRSLAFENFTGPNGQWINFLNTEQIRNQMGVGTGIQNYFIGYVYDPNENSSGSSSIMRGLLNRIERQKPRIPHRCRPY